MTSERYTAGSKSNPLRRPRGMEIGNVGYSENLFTCLFLYLFIPFIWQHTCKPDISKDFHVLWFNQHWWRIEQLRVCFLWVIAEKNIAYNRIFLIKN